MKLLIIEDNADLAQVLKAGLKQNGYTVSHTSDGLEGLDLLLSDTFQVAIAMAVFSWIYTEAPLWAGLLIAIPFAALGVMLWMAKPKFDGMVGGEIDQGDAQEEVDG